MGAVNPFEAFRTYFWPPPRAHGEQDPDRSVSFLELFYDLVYVVVIGRAAHHLAEHVSWRGAFDFVVVFTLIWIAWLNGSLYQDLHGRDDGRSRTFIFLQMLILALLAVYTGEATGADGTRFALTYSAFLGVLMWLWYAVRRRDTPEWMQLTGRYLLGMGIAIAMMVVSAFVGDDQRVVIWALLAFGWIASLILINFLDRDSPGVPATESTVERFGLFTIIVLGEVVVGVVQGISGADRTPLTIVTGLLCLTVGFAFWWTYFDFAGSRAPRVHGPTRALWITGHLPVTMAIAGAGAAMVSLVEHAGDGRTPAPTAWLISGSVALGLVALVGVLATLADAVRLASVYRTVMGVLGIAAGASLALGWLRPRPWLLALSLLVVLMAVWIVAIFRWIRLDDEGEHVPGTAGGS